MDRRDFLSKSVWAGTSFMAAAGGFSAFARGTYSLEPIDLSRIDLDYKVAFAPENFLFGVAYAPFLSEGGYNYPDGIKNNLAELELNGMIEKSGEAVRFWTNYEEHLKLASSLGLNAFRMGVDWARVQPTTSLKPHDPPEWDWEAVDHYAEIIATMIRYGMEPIITLHHFTHPAWLKGDMWCDDYGPGLFVDYSIKVVEELNRRLLNKVNRIIKIFVTSNEANLFPLANLLITSNLNKIKATRRAYDNLFLSIAKIYDGLYNLYEDRGWDPPSVSYNVASSCFYEQDKMFFDLLRLKEFGIDRSDVFDRIREFKDSWEQRLGALARAKLNKKQFRNYKLLHAFASYLLKPSAMKKTIDYVYSSPRQRKLDYLGVDIYGPFSFVRGEKFGEALPMYEFLADEEIYECLIRAYNDHNETDTPIFLIENGLHYKQSKGGEAEPRWDGWTKEKYFKRYMSKMIECMSEGIPINGYLFWSLTDDYEWSSFDSRCGLYNYDFVNHVIKETDGLGEPAGPIYRDIIALLTRGDKEEIVREFALNSI